MILIGISYVRIPLTVDLVAPVREVAPLPNTMLIAVEESMSRVKSQEEYVGFLVLSRVPFYHFGGSVPGANPCARVCGPVF